MSGIGATGYVLSIQSAKLIASYYRHVIHSLLMVFLLLILNRPLHTLIRTAFNDGCFQILLVPVE
jgi:hypothetical protein